MLPASEQFALALRRSHTRLSRVGIWLPNLSGAFILEGYAGLADGSLTQDARSQVRRTGSMTISSLLSTTDGAFLSQLATREDLEQLQVKGAQVSVDTGIRFLDGTEEWVTVARLRLPSLNRARRAAAASLQGCTDAGSRVTEYPLVGEWAPYDGAGTRYSTIEAIQALVAECYPPAHQPTWTTTGVVDSPLPDGLVFTGSRWDAITKLASGLGAAAYAGITPSTDGAEDVWHLASVTPSSTPVWTIDAGADGVLVDEVTSYSRAEQYNGIPLKWGTSQTGEYLTFLVDDDPTSPTYWDGSFGRKPRPTETNSTITDADQAMAACQALLAEYTGFTRSMQITCAANPLLEGGDTVAVQTTTGDIELHVIDSIPGASIGGGTMQLNTRVLR